MTTITLCYDDHPTRLGADSKRTCEAISTLTTLRVFLEFNCRFIYVTVVFVLVKICILLVLGVVKSAHLKTVHLV